jgi:hypothetical protein
MYLYRNTATEEIIVAKNLKRLCQRIALPHSYERTLSLIKEAGKYTSEGITIEKVTPTNEVGYVYGIISKDGTIVTYPNWAAWLNGLQLCCIESEVQGLLSFIADAGELNEMQYEFDYTPFVAFVCHS